MKTTELKCLFGAMLVWLAQGARAELVETDVCIYGGTSAGVIAAVQTVKMGKSVVLLEPGKHLGGLTSGGLGMTDIGNKSAIGGLSRDFYRQLGKSYGKEEAWTFEPSVAERQFEALIQAARVPVRFAQHLASVKKENARIVEISTENGDIIRAKMFIDASYEGDLMAKAGVGYHVGREANATYGETLNGIRDRTPAHQFIVPVDPYIKAGDPASGLLPFVQNIDFGAPGTGDQSVQAYNFRLCLTKNPANKLPINPPANYDPNRYELLGRYFDALAAAGKKVSLANFLKIDMVTPEKTDINNQGGFSTDYVGMNYSYPEADYAARERIKGEHLQYIQGFLTYLATSPRAPEQLRAEMKEWGLCRDEFPDTQGWPRQMYVRESRRMISDYVMTEKHCRRTETVPDSVGLAAYNMDSHNCRRVVRDGRAENEGDVQVPPMSPYAISYRAIVPKQAECENLFVPVCLAASHIAYGSIRMEPVFMILGQSSATAAAFAIDDKVPAQQVNYPRLRERLINDHQILEWPVTAQAQGHPFVCTDYTQGKVFIVSAQGKVEWDYSSPSCNDLWVLPNGNLLFNAGHGVKEVTREKAVVFNYESKSEIYACQRLENGDTFIGECNSGRLLEVSAAGKIVKEIKLLPEGKDGGHGYIRNARKLKSGNYLVTHYEGNMVREYDPQGKVVREIPAPGGPHSVIRLPNGNTLFSCGDLTGQPKVVEVDSQGTVVWQVQANDIPGISLKFVAGLQRLPNGNTVLCNWLGHGHFGEAPHIIEITPEKKAVWTFADHKTMRTISNVQLLDVPGNVIRGEIYH